MFGEEEDDEDEHEEDNEEGEESRSREDQLGSTRLEGKDHGGLLKITNFTEADGRRKIFN